MKITICEEKEGICRVADKVKAAQKFKRIINPKSDERLFRFESPKIVLRKLRDVKRKGLDKEIAEYEHRKLSDNRQISEDTITNLDITEETMALRIIRKFGSMKNIHAAFKAAGHPKTKSVIYRWLYPKERGGTGGIIPGSAMPALHKAAFVAGIYLTPEDLDIRPTIKKDLRRVGTRLPDGSVQAFLNSIERKTIKNHKIEKRNRSQAISRVIKRTKALVTKKLEKRFKSRIEKLEAKIENQAATIKQLRGLLK